MASRVHLVTSTLFFIKKLCEESFGEQVCAAGGYLYALGGHEAPANAVGGRLACVERYDPVADSWLLLARLSYGRDAIGSCLLGDRIVAVGKLMFYKISSFFRYFRSSAPGRIL